MADNSPVVTPIRPCDAIPGTARLALTLLVIVVSSLIPLEHWPAHGLLLVVVFAGLSLAGVTLGYLARRLMLFLPMLLVFGVSVPITQLHRESAWGWTLYHLVSGRTVVDPCAPVSGTPRHPVALALSSAVGRDAGLHVPLYFYLVG